MAMAAAEFLSSLRNEVTEHRAVRHPLLQELAESGDLDAYRVFGRYHYPLVATFTRYLELLLLGAPNSQEKLWIAKVLVDEYGEGSDGEDHAALYRNFLTGIGASLDICDTPAPSSSSLHIETHLRMCERRDFSVGLGAVGPGHEWAIPAMFPPLLRGLERLGADEATCAYFALHLEQDIEHGQWMEEALLRVCDDPATQAKVREGALGSLDSRARLWDRIQAQVGAGLLEV